MGVSQRSMLWMQGNRAFHLQSRFVHAGAQSRTFLIWLSEILRGSKIAPGLHGAEGGLEPYLVCSSPSLTLLLYVNNTYFWHTSTIMGGFYKTAYASAV